MTTEGGVVRPTRRVSSAILPPPDSRGRSGARNRLARAQVRRALEAVDAVHVIRPGATIPVRPVMRHPDFGGQYFYNSNTGRPTGIELNVTATVPELALLHEIGHFIDHQALGTPGRFASRDHPDLEPWRQAVRRTESWRALDKSRTGRPDSDLLAALGYLLRYTELWARSYATFVAFKSRDPVLLEQVADEHSADFPNGTSQWTIGDFRPVFDEIDKLFAQRGWFG